MGQLDGQFFSVRFIWNSVTMLAQFHSLCHNDAWNMAMGGCDMWISNQRKVVHARMSTERWQVWQTV